MSAGVVGFLHALCGSSSPSRAPFRCKRPGCDAPWSGGRLMLCAAHEEQHMDLTDDARAEEAE